MRSKSPWKVIQDAVYAWLSGWVTWVPVCFVWMICWGTVILGPPATFALAQGAAYAVLGILPDWRDLIRGLLRYFWLSWAWMLVNLAFFALVTLPYTLRLDLPGALLSGLKWVTIVLVVFWLVIQFFAIPSLMMADEKNIFAALSDSARIITSAPGYALVTAGAGLFIGLACLILVAPLILGGAALVAVLGSQTTLDRPKQISRNGQNQ